MTAPSSKRKFWAYAASFGALWGAFEALLGVFLHALQVPFTGLMLASLGCLILAAQRRVAPWAGISLMTGLIAGFCRAITPSTALLGPLIGIVTEALLVELAFLLLGRGTLGAIFGGLLAALWSISQGLVMKVILYGAPVVELAVAMAEKLLGWVGLSLSSGIWAVIVFFGIIGLVGAVAGGVGSRMGRSLVHYREELIASKEGAP